MKNSAKRRFKCLRCGKEITLEKGIPDENMGGECLGDAKGKYWWTSF